MQEVFVGLALGVGFLGIIVGNPVFLVFSAVVIMMMAIA